MSASYEITALLRRWANGDQQALEDLTGRVYAELRQLAAGYLRKERRYHTLQPTALVNEAYVRLLDPNTTALLPKPICFQAKIDVVIVFVTRRNNDAQECSIVDCK